MDRIFCKLLQNSDLTTAITRFSTDRVTMKNKVVTNKYITWLFHRNYTGDLYQLFGEVLDS